MPGQLWVLDGVDGAGKATQVELLIKRLNESGLLGKNKAHHIFFPNYQEKPWGVLTRQYLDGVFGPLDSVGPYSASLLYAGDRAQHGKQMHELLEKGDWVICDRYVPSSIAFQSAKIKSQEDKLKYADWLIETEYNLFGIPRPSGVIILSIPIEVSHKRTELRRDAVRQKGGSMDDKVGHVDIHEQNTDFMKRAMQEYVSMAKHFGWDIVDCVENGRELSREEVSEKVWQKISQTFAASS